MTENPITLLDLSDAAIEDVMAAVLMWCNDFDISLTGEIGQRAMAIAVERRRDAKLSVEKIVTILTGEIQIG